MPVVATEGGGNKKEYPGELTRVVIVACVIAATGGFTFGYDMGITGGVISMDPFLKEFFFHAYKMKNGAITTDTDCQYNSAALTIFTSSLYVAALFSSLVASAVSRNLGLTLSMFIGGILCFLGALVNAFAHFLWMLIVGRILLGIGIGFSSQAVPLYISEMAPSKYRGRMSIGFQLSVALGVFFANGLNYSLSKLIKEGLVWRYSLGFAMMPALIITAGSLFLSETPISMIESDPHGAKVQLQRIRGIHDVDEEFDDLVTAYEASTMVHHPWRCLLQRKYRPQLTMAVLLPLFQQFSGINVVLFYAPVFFNSIGFTDDSSLSSTLIIGGVFVATTCVSIYGVDKWGRRALFLAGGAQMFICQVAVAVAIGFKFEGGKHAAVLVAFICIYVGGFAWSWGPLAWLVPSEIFPFGIRSTAQSVTVSVNMLSTFVVAQLFLPMLCKIRFGLFLFFACFEVGMTLFIFYLLPETKSIPMEEMDTVWKSHPFWAKFVEHRGNEVELSREA